MLGKMNESDLKEESIQLTDVEDSGDSVEVTEDSEFEETSKDETLIVKNSNAEATGRQKWSKHCKFLLLKALKKHGHCDIQRIWEDLPNKSLTSIRAMINKMKAKSQKVYRRNKPPLSEWLKSGLLPAEDSLVPQALLFIHLFEEHPKYPDETNYDFRAAYHFLYNLTLGCPALDIPKETEKMLYALICKITRNISKNKASREDIYSYLKKTYKKKEIRTYPAKKKTSAISSIS